MLSVLRLDPKDDVASSMKLSLLVQMDEFAKAAEMLAEGDERGLVYAYTMYKLAKYAETREAMATGEGRGFMHLKAQLVRLNVPCFQRRKTDSNTSRITGKVAYRNPWIYTMNCWRQHQTKL